MVTSKSEQKFHFPIAMLLLAGVGGLALFSLNKINEYHSKKHKDPHHHKAELDLILEEDIINPTHDHYGQHPPPIPSTVANNIESFDFHGVDVPNDKYNFGHDFDPITVPNFKKKSGTLYRMGWVVPNFEDVPVHQVDQESKTPFVPSYKHHLKNQPLLSRVANDSYSIYNDDKRGDGFSTYLARVSSFNTSSVGGSPVGPGALISSGPTGVGAAVGGSINTGGGGVENPFTATATATPPSGPFPPIPINQFQGQNPFSEFGPGGPQPVNSTDPVFDASVADTNSLPPPVIVDPGNMSTPHIIGIKNQIMKMIIANTVSVNTILTNVDTIKKSIDHYGHKLHQAYEQLQVGNITPPQFQQFLLQIVSDIANELQLPLTPQFAAQLNQSPFMPVSPAMI